jgi:ubiquinone/menaquinone biosynthesis C-methylase UbiE
MTDGDTAAGGHEASSAERSDHATRTASPATIRDTYADQADTMDRLDVLNRLFTGRYRHGLFGRGEGRVLDVACGVGTNRRYLPADVEYVGVDLSPDMLTKAAGRHDDLERGESLLEMDAQDLAFEDDSFDTVVSSLSTCTFPDPIAALQEMQRVCRPGGRILLLEHGRSSVGPIASVQEWRADAHFEKHACRWTQEPLELVRAAGLAVEDSSTALFGVITAIEARPDDVGTGGEH